MRILVGYLPNIAPFYPAVEIRLTLQTGLSPVLH